MACRMEQQRPVVLSVVTRSSSTPLWDRPLDVQPRISHRTPTESINRTRRVGMRASARTPLATLAMTALLTLVFLSTPTSAKLPKHEDRAVLCEACNATLVELEAMVAKTEKNHGRESAIVDALEELCADMYRFVRYEYPPPKMKRGCEIIVEENEDLISDLVYKRDPETREKVCATACEGVDERARSETSRTTEVIVDGVAREVEL